MHPFRSSDKPNESHLIFNNDKYKLRLRKEKISDFFHRQRKQPIIHNIKTSYFSDDPSNFELQEDLLTYPPFKINTLELEITNINKSLTSHSISQAKSAIFSLRKYYENPSYDSAQITNEIELLQERGIFKHGTQILLDNPSDCTIINEILSIFINIAFFTSSIEVYNIFFNETLILLYSAAGDLNQTIITNDILQLGINIISIKYNNTDCIKQVLSNPIMIKMISLVEEGGVISPETMTNYLILMKCLITSDLVRQMSRNLNDINNTIGSNIWEVLNKLCVLFFIASVNRSLILSIISNIIKINNSAFYKQLYTGAKSMKYDILVYMMSTSQLSLCNEKEVKEILIIGKILKNGIKYSNLEEIRTGISKDILKYFHEILLKCNDINTETVDNTTVKKYILKAMTNITSADEQNTMIIIKSSIFMMFSQEKMPCYLGYLYLKLIHTCSGYNCPVITDELQKKNAIDIIIKGLDDFNIERDKKIMLRYYIETMTFLVDSFESVDSKPHYYTYLLEVFKLYKEKYEEELKC